MVQCTRRQGGGSGDAIWQISTLTFQQQSLQANVAKNEFSGSRLQLELLCELIEAATLLGPPKITRVLISLGYLDGLRCTVDHCARSIHVEQGHS